MRAQRRLLLLCSVCGLCLLIAAGTLAGQPARAEEPSERDLVAAFEFPGLSVPVDGEAEVDLILKNRGTRDETLTLSVLEKPQGWKASFRSYGKAVTGVFVEGESKETVAFQALPQDGQDRLQPGTHRFQVLAETQDGAVSRKASVVFQVTEEESEEQTIGLSTSYPILRGPSDTSFEFSLNVANKSSQDGLYNLQARAPEGWETAFKPAYEDKQISSLHIKANQSKSVKVSVTPPRQAQTGTYPIDVRVWRGGAEAASQLKVELTGTYALSSRTPNGLLSTETKKGSQAIMSILVENTGSAVQKEISFLSFKPENWQVEFEPKTITNLEPGEVQQTDVRILPPEDALVGDYSVGVKTKGQKASDSVEFRVTVKASSTWGWIGVGIIILVIAGLAVTFRVLGRR